jgi:RHS repeat-associated protein
MDKDFINRSLSSYDWQTRFHGETRDDETGFYNYGYRYYDPKTGRWPSRDPIAERGGVNLYGFIKNDGANYVDILGMTASATGEKSICECLVFFLQLQGPGRQGAGAPWKPGRDNEEGPRRPFPVDGGNLPVTRPDWERWYGSGSHPDQRWAVGAEWKSGASAKIKTEYTTFDLTINAVNPYPAGSGRSLANSKSRNIQGAIGTEVVVTGKSVRGNGITRAPIPALPPLGRWPTESPPVNPLVDNNTIIEYRFLISVGDETCMTRKFSFIEAWEGGLGTGVTPGDGPKLPSPPKP